MPLPTTTLALFDLLAADTVLTPLLGVHVLEGGATRRALAHFWPKETIEPTTQPAGVEIVVWRSPMGTATTQAQTGEVDVRPTFRLSVTQWEPPTAGGACNQLAVLNRLLQLLPGANASDVTIDGLTTGLQQHSVTWACPVAVLQRP
jgi:hypothetical protein